METLKNKKQVKRVQEVISKFDSKLKVITLNKSAKTAKEAASLLKCEVGSIVKSLLFKVDNNFLICLIAGDKRCSLKKLKKILQKESVHMADANEVKENTGFSIGGVAPVGYKKELDILIDKSLNRFKSVFAAAGHPNCIFEISYYNLIKITKGSEKEISE
jgi:Cys-tRNA(Pro) deacylase